MRQAHRHLRRWSGSEDDGWSRTSTETDRRRESRPDGILTGGYLAGSYTNPAAQCPTSGVLLPLYSSRAAVSTHGGIPADTRCWPNVGLKLGRRRRRWPNFNPTLSQRLVSLGLYGKSRELTVIKKSADISSVMIFPAVWYFPRCDILRAVIFPALWYFLLCDISRAVIFPALWFFPRCDISRGVIFSALWYFPHCDISRAVIFPDLCYFQRGIFSQFTYVPASCKQIIFPSVTSEIHSRLTKYYVQGLHVTSNPGPKFTTRRSWTF